MVSVCVFALVTGVASAAARAETTADKADATEKTSDSTSLLRPTWIVPRRSGGSASDSAADVVVDETSADESVEPTSMDVRGTDGEEAAGDTEVSDTSIGQPDSAPSVQAEAPAQEALDEDKDWRLQSRIVIHGTAEAERLAELVAGLLTDLGARDIEQREVDITVAQDHVRYFHREDALMARELATELDDVFGRVDLRPLTRYQPSPSPGLLELWLR